MQKVKLFYFLKININLLFRANPILIYILTF